MHVLSEGNIDVVSLKDVSKLEYELLGNFPPQLSKPPSTVHHMNAKAPPVDTY